MNARPRYQWIWAPACLVLVVGCGGNGTLVRMSPSFGSTRALATSADVRLVTATAVESSNGEYVVPRQITCAEPSPDVAKIVTEAFGGGGALFARARGRELPVSGDLNTTLALAASHAEGVAQMTERLATIQLLRDGLYRACEAYSNGAISTTTYAALISRYDKTMITLLMGELAAGNFGRSLAGIAGTASSKASASSTVKDLQKRVADASHTVDRSRQRTEEAAEAAEDALESGAEPETAQAAQNNLRNAQESYKEALTQHQELLDQLDVALAASAESQSATSVTPGGAIPHASAEAMAVISAQLVQLQANYLNDNNLDAVKIACISSFGREDPHGEVDQVDVGSNGAKRYRYRYRRALSSWCDELVQTLKRNGELYMNLMAQNGLVPPAPVMDLLAPEPVAIGPYNVPREQKHGFMVAPALPRPTDSAAGAK